MTNRKLLSTVLLFAIFIGFLWWGISMLIHPADAETVVYALLILGCAGYAGVSILMLPRKKER